MTHRLSQNNPKSYPYAAIRNFGRMSWLVTRHGKDIGWIPPQMRSPPSTPTQPGPTTRHRLPGVPVSQTVSTESLPNRYRTGGQSPRVL
ncbi:MAG: hypothetical protein ACRCU2_18440 [Planktothrix sp.]